MDEPAFRAIVEEEWAQVPERYRVRVDNVALLVEDEPSEEVRKLEGLKGEDTLLGIYQGIPLIERGEGYGMTLPDTITVYWLPTLLEAEQVLAENPALTLPEAVRQVVRDTVWHELGHYFGHGEAEIGKREDEGTNLFGRS